MLIYIYRNIPIGSVMLNAAWRERTCRGALEEVACACWARELDNGNAQLDKAAGCTKGVEPEGCVLVRVGELDEAARCWGGDLGYMEGLCRSKGDGAVMGLRVEEAGVGVDGTGVKANTLSAEVDAAGIEVDAAGVKADAAGASAASAGAAAAAAGVAMAGCKSGWS